MGQKKEIISELPYIQIVKPVTIRLASEGGPRQTRFYYFYEAIYAMLTFFCLILPFHSCSLSQN